jgi:hypothetical protein
MEQLVELLRQIQELAGVAIDALEGAGGEGGAPEGGAPAPSEQMAEGREGGAPPPEEEQ